MVISKLDSQVQMDTSGATILVVDDQPINIQTIYNILNPTYVVLAATSGEDALELCLEKIPDLILLDVLMPDMSGLELCGLLKRDERIRDVPVIFVTSINDQEEESSCWEAGAVDFITKPVNATTLINRIRAHLTIKYQRDILLQLVFVDGLTGVYNRRYFDEHLLKFGNIGSRTTTDTAVLLLDIDSFKLYNDHYGHLKGDEVLRNAANLVKSSLLRPADFVSRYGGEEFAVVLPDTDFEGASEVAERIRSAFFNKNIEHVTSSHRRLTVSIGISTFNVAKKQNMKVVELADANLYEAKSRGRNTVYPDISSNDNKPKASVLN
ncbi:diguanylate cyclase [Rheinheimera aquimaris]|uniref:diguanylate cyclase n=1 Tax=Rheinheimera aquimaris TaxID=412437 RepID=A0ABN1ECD1_9GAMM|nr:diguanylate cyclase [Rheinheimera aquimaris]MCB5215370.1 diguanylate cyclase [Rheinheimera aquimaris]